jgi:hypothetical protein
MVRCKNCKFKEGTDSCSRNVGKNYFTNIPTSSSKTRDKNYKGGCLSHRYDWVEFFAVTLITLAAGSAILLFISEMLF